ncbi:TolB family protein [Streptomyces sp. NPDC048172]|uniref:TolB family protein n=1 Tax=Streptomyces sp. NPDC048172 TaxID=3365505 RepID=UPI003714E3D2
MTGTANRSTTRRIRAALSAAVAACAVTAVLPGATAAASAAAAADSPGIERISVASDGTQGDARSADAAISPDGRRVVFSSAAQNLTSDIPSTGDKVYVRDRRTSHTQRMGHLAPTEPPTISGDGDYISYSHEWMGNVRIRQYELAMGRSISGNCSLFSCSQPSLSTDGGLIAQISVSYRQQTYGQRVEVEERRTGTLKTIATFSHTKPSRPSMSGDGRYVAYQDAEAGDVFVHDRTTGTTSAPVEGPSQQASLLQLSEDGSKLVYLSGTDTYVHDVSAGTRQLVPDVRGVAIDPTGRYLLYAPHDAADGPSLVLRDLRTGTDETVATQPAAAGTDAVSAGGRDVVFHSAADDLVPDDTNGASDIFVRRFY